MLWIYCLHLQLLDRDALDAPWILHMLYGYCSINKSNAPLSLRLFFLLKKRLYLMSQRVFPSNVVQLRAPLVMLYSSECHQNASLFIMQDTAGFQSVRKHFWQNMIAKKLERTKKHVDFMPQTSFQYTFSWLKNSARSVFGHFENLLCPAT